MVINNRGHIFFVRSRRLYSSRTSYVGALRYLRDCQGILADDGRLRCHAAAPNNNSFPSTIASWEEWGVRWEISRPLYREVACVGIRTVTVAADISKIQRSRWCIMVNDRGAKASRAVNPLSYCWRHSSPVWRLVATSIRTAICTKIQKSYE